MSPSSHRTASDASDSKAQLATESALTNEIPFLSNFVIGVVCGLTAAAGACAAGACGGRGLTEGYEQRLCCLSNDTPNQALAVSPSRPLVVLCWVVGGGPPGLG